MKTFLLSIHEDEYVGNGSLPPKELRTRRSEGGEPCRCVSDEKRTRFAGEQHEIAMELALMHLHSSFFQGLTILFERANCNRRVLLRPPISSKQASNQSVSQSAGSECDRDMCAVFNADRSSR